MIDGPDGSPLVLGPAYLDRVIRVDRPLLDPTTRVGPIDRSVDGRWVAGDPSAAGRIRLVDPADSTLEVDPPAGWPGSVGAVVLARRFADRGAVGSFRRAVRGVGWSEDLGGMGAGFAASLGGTLISALGPPDDPTSRAIAGLLGRAGIRHEPIRVGGHAADWTLLISSGPHGDKLAIGFRGCHAAWTDFDPWRDRSSRVRVVAALPNRVAAEALGAPGASQVRAFFPAARNMLDRVDPLARFADRFDFLSCNRGEWDDLGDQAAALERVPVVAITDGPRGALVRFVDEAGMPDRVEVPVMPRTRPIVDTNRAGEAFGSTLLATLVEAGWTPGPAHADLIRSAAWRASAASAIVLGRSDFGFPTPDEVDRAVRAGRV